MSRASSSHSCSILRWVEPWPPDGKEGQHRATSALLWLPEQPVLPQPCLGALGLPPSCLRACHPPVTPSALSERRTCWLNTCMGVSEQTGVFAAHPESLLGCEQEGHRQSGMVQGQGTTSSWDAEAAAATSAPSQSWGAPGTSCGVQRSPCLLCSHSKGVRQHREFKDLPAWPRIPLNCEHWA